MTAIVTITTPLWWNGHAWLPSKRSKGKTTILTEYSVKRDKSWTNCGQKTILISDRLWLVHHNRIPSSLKITPRAPSFMALNCWNHPILSSHSLIPPALFDFRPHRSRLARETFQSRVASQHRRQLNSQIFSLRTSHLAHSLWFYPSHEQIVRTFDREVAKTTEVV